MPTNCVACKEKHPLWRCPVFRKKTPTERAKLVADNKLGFSCFRVNHSVRQCPQPRKCTKEGFESSHNTILHCAERIFQRKSETPNRENPEPSTCIGTTKMNDQVAKSSGMPSVVDVNGFLQKTEVELHSNELSERVLALCDSACSHTRISSRLADKLTVKGTPEVDSACHQLPSSCKHSNGGAQVDTGSFGWLLLLLCNQTICERRSSSWNRCYRRRITTENNVPPFRTKSFEEVQLC